VARSLILVEEDDMNNKLRYILLTVGFVLTLGVVSATLIGVDDTLKLFTGFADIAEEVKQ